MSTHNSDEIQDILVPTDFRRGTIHIFINSQSPALTAAININCLSAFIGINTCITII